MYSKIGLLYFSEDRHWFTGQVTLPTNQYPKPEAHTLRSAALSNPHQLFTTEVRGSSTSTYTCEISKNGFATEKEAVEAAHSTATQFYSSADKDPKVPPITYGVKFNAETSKPETIFTVGGVDWMQLFGLSLDKDYNAIISFIYNSDLVSFVREDHEPQYPLCPAGGSFTMHWDGKVFWGYVKIYDPATNMPSDKFYAFKGTVQAELLKATHVRLNHVMYKTALLGAEKSLSIDELRGLTVSDTVLQEAANKLMVVAMKYHASDFILENFFGEVRPSLDNLPFMKDAVKSEKGKKFYGEDFLNPYLGSGLNSISGAAKPKRTMTAEEKRKVAYYLSVGLSKNAEYNTQNHALYQQAYVNTESRIGLYLSDQANNSKNRFYWADQLYDAIKEGAMIRNLANIVIKTGDYTLVKRYTFLLELLGRPELGEKFGHSVVSVAISSTINDVTAKALTDPYLDVLKKFVNDYSSDPGASAPKEAINRYLQAMALKDAARIMGSIDNLGRAIADLFVAVRHAGDSISKSVGKLMAQFAMNYPDFYGKLETVVEYLYKGVLATCWGAGLYSVIVGWTNLKNMDRLEITELALRTASMAGEFALGIPVMGNLVSRAGKWVWELAAEGATYLGECLVTEWMTTKFTQLMDWFAQFALEDDHWLVNIARWIGETMKDVGEFIGGAISKAFNWAQPYIRGFLKCLGPFIAAVAALNAIKNFINDFKNKDVSDLQKALDGLLMVFSILEFVVVFCGIFWPSSFLTFAGVLLAIAAVIVALVQMFHPPPPPPTPVDIFMNDTFYPWLKKQTDPPADYKPPAPPVPESDKDKDKAK